VKMQSSKNDRRDLNSTLKRKLDHYFLDFNYSLWQRKSKRNN